MPGTSFTPTTAHHQVQQIDDHLSVQAIIRSYQVRWRERRLLFGSGRESISGSSGGKQEDLFRRVKDRRSRK